MLATHHEHIPRDAPHSQQLHLILNLNLLIIGARRGALDGPEVRREAGLLAAGRATRRQREHALLVDGRVLHELVPAARALVLARRLPHQDAPAAHDRAGDRDQAPDVRAAQAAHRRPVELLQVRQQTEARVHVGLRRGRRRGARVGGQPLLLRGSDTVCASARARGCTAVAVGRGASTTTRSASSRRGSITSGCCIRAFPRAWS